VRALEVLAAAALLWLAMVPLLWMDYQAERDRQREARLRELVDRVQEPAPDAAPVGTVGSCLRVPAHTGEPAARAGGPGRRGG